MASRHSLSTNVSTSLTLSLLFLTVVTATWHYPSSGVYPSTRLSYKNPRNVPTEFCPRDEAQVQLQGRACLRKCTSDEDCKSKRKKCFCDGACGLSCIKPERECGDPEPPSDMGQVQITGKMFGSKALYSCPDGFRVIGMDERLCQADGTWSGTPPACKKNIYCTEPPVIENAKHNAPLGQLTFDLDTALQYQCLPGYNPKGFARTKCFFYNNTSKWFGPDITCEPRSCGQPRDILNGRREGICFHFSCKVQYVCQAGFELVGRPTHHCQADGTWAPKELPTCVPVQCPLPENPLNGKALFNNLAFNSEAKYECKYGFILVGEESRRCGPNKKWSGVEPACKEINCGSPGLLANGWLEGSRTTLHAIIIFHCRQEMTFDGAEQTVCQANEKWSHPLPKCHEINCGHPGFLHNGWLENIEGGTALGASIIFRCYDGMTLVGHTSSVCHIDGKWRYPLPKCLAPCLIPHIEYGNVTSRPELPGESGGENVTASPDGSTTVAPVPTKEPIRLLNPGSSIPHGKIVGVRCDKLYEPSFNITPATCNNGTFTHPPKCQPARCKSLPRSPRNGMVIAPKTEHGMKARFTCRDGYILEGSNVTECQFGQWNGEPPTCNQTFCKFPGSIPNGRVLLVGNMGLYDYRNYVTKVANNRQIMFDCDKGFVLSEGPPGKTCIRGEWAPKADAPRCLTSQHPNFRWTRSLRRQKRRAIKTSSSVSRVGKIGGGSGGGSSTRRVGKKKNRYGDEEEYDAIPQSCDPLPSIDDHIIFSIIQNGVNINDTFSAGAIHRVSCRQGFNVNLQNETIQCVNGRWKPKPPACSAVPCKAPYIMHASFYDGSKAIFFQEPVKHGKIVDFKCSKGYRLKGPNKLDCNYGEWNAMEVPECLPSPCSLPSIENGNYLGAYRTGATVSHGASVDYVCSGSYKKISHNPITCQIGEMKPHKPACIHASISSPQEFDEPKGKKKGSGSKGSVVKRTASCGLPPVEKLAYTHIEGLPIDFDKDLSFENGTEIHYRCASLKPRARHRWKMLCEDGVWTGNKNNTLSIEGCKNETTEEGAANKDEVIAHLHKLVNGSCKYTKGDINVVTFYNDHEVLDDTKSIPHGAVLTSRCVDIGKFKLLGAVKRRCVSTEWFGVTPTCDGLSQHNDYDLSKSPTILFRYNTEGAIVQSNDGKMVITPGTTLNMECLWIRKYGSPKWHVSNSDRSYQEGWVTEEGRDSQLEYRLTVENASVEDAGTYSCATPARHTHTISIIVKNAECPPLPDHPDLIYSSQNRNLGAKVNFTCQNNNALIGPKEIFCGASGNWSGLLPRCENVECRDISLLPAMAPGALVPNNTTRLNETSPPKITLNGKHVGNKAEFTCPSGYTTQGASEAICLKTGEWSAPIPRCREVECGDPDAPENGVVSGNAPFKVGEVVQFECKPGFMLEGQPMIACQENGKWSKPIGGMKCVHACTYPGTIIGGTISEVKYYYRTGSSVTFECLDGYRLHGTRMLHCGNKGKWSNTVPNCVAKSDKQ